MEVIECLVWIGGVIDSFKEMDIIYEKCKIWLKNSWFELFLGGYYFYMVNLLVVSNVICWFVEEM